MLFGTMQTVDTPVPDDIDHPDRCVRVMDDGSWKIELNPGNTVDRSGRIGLDSEIWAAWKYGLKIDHDDWTHDLVDGSGQKYEVKSCRWIKGTSLPPWINGQFQFRRNQHNHLKKTGGMYILIVISSGFYEPRWRWEFDVRKYEVLTPSEIEEMTQIRSRWSRRDHDSMGLHLACDISWREFF